MFFTEAFNSQKYKTKTTSLVRKRVYGLHNAEGYFLVYQQLISGRVDSASATEAVDWGSIPV